jgi:hypothetical protein
LRLAKGASRTFDCRHFQAQLDAPLADAHRVIVQQSNGGEFFLIGSCTRYVIDGVVQPLPFALHLFLSGAQLG